jgi:hypothetical protein
MTTEVMLKKLEDRIMLLVGELENLRKELQYTCHELDRSQRENSALKSDKQLYMEKLQKVISLLESVELTEDQSYETTNQYDRERMEPVGAY